MYWGCLWIMLRVEVTFGKTVKGYSNLTLVTAVKEIQNTKNVSFFFMLSMV
jgi:hypothetical protein